MLALQAQVGKAKKSSKKLPPVGIQLGTSAIPVWAIWANLVLPAKLILLRSLDSCTILILTKTSNSKNNWCTYKIQL